MKRLRGASFHRLLSAVQAVGLYGGQRVPATAELVDSSMSTDFDSPSEKDVNKGLAVYSHNVIENALYVAVFESVAIGLSHFGRVLEVGGGDGSLARLLPFYGFAGEHFIVDLPPMHLLQRFFLRLHGHPAWLAEGLLEARSGVNLEIAGSSALRRHLTSTSGRPTLFIAANSLCEMPLHARRVILRDARGHADAWFVQFYEGFEGINNLEWFLDEIRIAGRSLWGFSVCLWQWYADRNRGMRKYVLVALNKTLGTVRCTAFAGCFPDTVIHC